MRRRRLLILAAVLATLGASGAVAPAASAAPDPPPPGSNDFSCEPSAGHPRPVVLLHGLGSNRSDNWSYHSPRIHAAGYCVFALTYGVDDRTRRFPRTIGGTVRMQRSARELRRFVRRVLRATGARRVDLVGHSEGTVMPRWYLERLGGDDKVRRFVALTPLWRGTNLGALATFRELAEPLGLSRPAVRLASRICASCPQFLRGSRYLRRLNRDGEAVPGIRHVNIVTRYDELVIPYTSGLMRDGGRNIVLQNVCPLNFSEHVAVAFDPVVTRLILNGLHPRSARPVRC